MNNNRNNNRGNTVLNKIKYRFNFIKKHIKNYLNNQNNQNNQITIDNKEEGNIEWKDLILLSNYLSSYFIISFLFIQNTRFKN